MYSSRLSSSSAKLSVFKRREQKMFLRKIRDHVQYRKGYYNGCTFYDYFVRTQFTLKCSRSYWFVAHLRNKEVKENQRNEGKRSLKYA
jgi:hypothetical protein